MRRRKVSKRVLGADGGGGTQDVLTSVATADGTATERQPCSANTGSRARPDRREVRSTGAYSDDRYLALFARYGAGAKPRFVLAVMLNEPRAGKFYGGRAAGPVFSAVMAEAPAAATGDGPIVCHPSVRMAQWRSGSMMPPARRTRKACCSRTCCPGLSGIDWARRQTVSSLALDMPRG